MKNKYLSSLLEKAKEKEASILIPESSDSRINEAISELKKNGFNIQDVNDFNEYNDKYIDFLFNKKFTNNWPKNEVISYFENPINKAMTILACNDVDGVVCGASVSTATVIRSALRIVGINKKSKWVSSLFFMVSPCQNKLFSYADCAVIPEPTSEQLAYIAKDTSDFHKLITKDEPRIAFLSFSTNGSANHYRVDRVKEATKIFSNKFPNIIHEGEIQFDAAISEGISANKNIDSSLNGAANVFIFPNLDAGNISYKITRELAGYSAYGPLLQGLDKPVHDLSRGCNVEDIMSVFCITALQKPS